MNLYPFSVFSQVEGADKLYDELVRISDEKLLNEDMKAIDRAINYRHSKRRCRLSSLHIHIHVRISRCRRRNYCRNLHGRVSSDKKLFEKVT